MAKFYFMMLVGVGIFNLVCSIQIVRRLAEADINVSLFELRWQVHKHLRTYRTITSETEGRVGLPFYAYLVSLVVLILLALLLILSLTEPVTTRGSL